MGRRPEIPDDVSSVPPEARAALVESVDSLRQALVVEQRARTVKIDVARMRASNHLVEMFASALGIRYS